GRGPTAAGLAWPMVALMRSTGVRAMSEPFVEAPRAALPSSRPTIVKSAWLYTYQQSCETTTYHPRLTAPATDLRSRGQASRCGRSKHNTPMTANPLTTAPHARAQYRRPRKAPTSVVEL